MATSSRKPRAVGDTPQHTIIVDWDGTAVPAMWPEQPRVFMPGFVVAQQRFLDAGYHVQIASARLNPLDPWTKQERPQSIIDAEVEYMRNLLDQYDLKPVDIWTRPGKPGGSVYIDDKAERYHGCNGCWRRMADKVLLRLGAEEAVFPKTTGEATRV